MTPELAIAILEGLKDHINDDGKRELTAVQKAIESWKTIMVFPDVSQPKPISEPRPEPEEKSPKPKKVIKKSAKSDKKK